MINILSILHVQYFQWYNYNSVSVCPSRCRSWFQNLNGRTGPGLEILGYGFQDMVFRTWDLNFEACEILGYGFQDMVFKTWDLNFGAWEILGYGFQDMVFKTWDLNFGAWIFTFAVSKTETWKLLGRDFQDVGPQFWNLDFTQGPSQWPSATGTH